MKSLRVLTGITTTGTPHLGNFVGSIRPSVAASAGSSTANSDPLPISLCTPIVPPIEPTSRREMASRVAAGRRSGQSD